MGTCAYIPAITIEPQDVKKVVLEFEGGAWWANWRSGVIDTEKATVYIDYVTTVPFRDLEIDRK